MNQFNNIYRSQRLDGGGAYHIYSAILTVELALYLSKQTACKIGIVCPYMTQATLVEKMIAAQTEPQKIVTGTVHRFQGDEFDIILNLLNAPPQISPNIFLNKQNILNVAISRAKDYLILIIPDIGGLDKIKRLETILKRDEIKPYYQEFTAAEIEKIIFKQANYIDDNAFIVAHQKVNVYAKAVKKYEIRMDDKAVDIQLDVQS
ncbi:superfamily I DNA/RNA helicase [Candidatus Thiomargarita nelsonii]|uniref:Superfamily I DNA/RNA helicase n=1 Tax=Candidatus Thiomargarita nelsonii TaxID=1003181 RepID=A0A176S2I0_9GAMM|nr:superfamily I DNA/RNA helicase [Candidatus Thiomargarita nelsonii]